MAELNIYRIKSTIEDIINEHGFDYDITLGVEVYENCTTTDDCLENIKKSFPDANTAAKEIIELSMADFWESFNELFDFKDNRHAGFILSPINNLDEERLKQSLADYRYFILQHITPKSTFYSYPDEKGIPGYSVWWDYRLILHNKEGKSLFIFGSASD